MIQGYHVFTYHNVALMVLTLHLQQYNYKTSEMTIQLQEG